MSDSFDEYDQALAQQLSAVSLAPASSAASINATSLKSMVSQTADVILRIILPAICAFGILGLVLTVLVLSRKTMRTSTNCYLMAFSLADLVFLLLLASVLLDAHFVTSNANAPPPIAVVVYRTYAAILMHIMLMTSVWLTVMLAVERHVAICRPFLAAKICTVARARVIIAVVLGIAVACRLPNFWENKVISYYDHSTNDTIYYLEPTEFSFNDHYMTVYPWLVDGILVSVLPFIILLVLNVLLVRAVHKSTRYLAQGSGGTSAQGAAQKEEHQITVMLIAIVVVFFVCQAPYVLYTALNSMHEFEPSSALLLFRFAAMVLLTLKSAVNFIAYCWFSDKFRTTLKRVLRGVVGERSPLAACRPRRGGGIDGDYNSVRMQTTCVEQIMLV